VNLFDPVRKKNTRTIILLHGAGVTHKWWHPQIDALSGEFRVIAPDLPGHGFRSETPFSMETAVFELADQIEQEADGRALVVGISLGGYIALWQPQYPGKGQPSGQFRAAGSIHRLAP
jgi:pimeloyl-ACP methyl ester carboxylesterase